jgi:hypothetical protein
MTATGFAGCSLRPAAMAVVEEDARSATEMTQLSNETEISVQLRIV